MNPKVDYVRVVDALADTIKELNVPKGEQLRCERSGGATADRRADALIVVRAMLHELERGNGADAAADRAAEHTASDSRWPWNPDAWGIFRK
jgi:hypothetical protein